ncbi:hypothetical protein [Microbacterium lacus]
MNTDDNDYENDSSGEGASTGRRPLGFWLRTVDALITHEFSAAFDGAGIDRRDWMLLNALSGEVELPAFAERFVRRGKRLRRLEERGWAVENGDGTWALTDEGRAARDELSEVVDGIRSRVAGAVSPEEYATTMASLEAIARELGWEEGRRMPRGGFGRRGGFGPGFGPRGGSGHGGGFGPGFAPDPHHCAHAHAGHGAPGHRRPHHHGERAYERGFDAGFARGRTAG